MITKTITAALVCLALTACVTVKTPQSRPKTAQEPVAWGLFSKPKGCVIFREYSKTQVGFFVVAVTTKSHGELEVVESQGYDMQPKVWQQTKESMDELQRLAMKEKLRYVKIPDKYLPEELESARKLCEKENIDS